MATSSDTFTETEATLVIRSEDPSSVVSALAALTSIADCSLQPRDSISIRDTYFDTGPAKDRFALRVREVGQKQLITVKGSTRKTDWGAVRRLEIEDVWSAASLRRAMEEIRAEPFQIPVHESEFDQISPLEIMKLAGLTVLQERETFRQLRDIMARIDNADQRVGELAIDSGIYHFPALDVRHYEVEIESKAQAETQTLSVVLNALVSMYGDVLLPWDWNKLSTGLAVERLLKSMTREALLDDNHVLRPEAYDLIDRELRQLS